MPSIKLLTPVLAAALSACSLAPVYQRPAMPVSQSLPADMPVQTNQSANTNIAAKTPWQDFIKDQELKKLITIALENNRDLKIAIANIEQTRAQYQISRASQIPTIGLSGSGSRTQTGQNTTSSYTTGIGASSWELDFFGRVASLKDAALSTYLATEEARKYTQTALIASIVNAWLQVQTNTKLQNLASKTLATRQDSLKLIKLRFENGVSGELDMQNAITLAASAKASLAEQKRLQAQGINALELLIGGQIPAEIKEKLLTQKGAEEKQTTSFSPVPVGISSEILLERSDIKSAEQNLKAANANIGAARANFFPRITLTGLFGRASTELGSLFDSGGARFWTFAPSISLPIFDMGANQARLDASKAARDIAVAQYEKTIQTAFKEIADALAGRATYTEQLIAVDEQLNAEKRRAELSELRYKNGAASHLDQLDAQRSLFAVEQNYLILQQAKQANEVAIYQALGGGWQ